MVIISAKNEKDFISRGFCGTVCLLSLVILANLLPKNNVVDWGHLMLSLFTTLVSCGIT